MDIKNSIVAILNTENEIIGTGFVAADCLIVTCAHVIDLAKAAPGGLVRVRFTVDNSERFADVDASTYSPKAELDVAILRVSQTPKGVQPLRMSASAGCSGHAFFATGYPKLGDFESLSARGEIISLEKDKRGDPYLQLRSQEVAPGMSGGPVLDTARNAVVGMVNSGFLLRADKKHRDTAFATPSETIWQVCPQLKPVVSPLSRRNPIVEGVNLLPYDYGQRIQNFLTEYLGTDLHPVPFGGRDDALHMLDTWLAETTPYLLLAAPAGRGKSALLIRWLDSLKEREDLALAFVPVSIRFGTNMERVFYAALAARLAYLHGDDVPASPETSTAVYRGLVSDYLSKPLANGRTLVVVLDGLDEAADWQAGADFMPGELPTGVRVVVSARFLAGDADSSQWLRRLNWERNELATAPSLTPLDQEGVRDVLFKMGCPLDELSRQVDIVAELYRLSEGDPLLVNFYVYDLWKQKEKAPRLKPEDLKKLKPGYDEYFKKWWADQRKLWGEKAPLKIKTTKLVFNLLCGAMGALTIDDLIALDTKDELDSFAIEDAIETLDRFVISVAIDERTQQTGYVITHPKFRDYFWNKLSDRERNRIEKRFLSWGERIFKEFVNGKRDPKDKNEVPFYVIRNYSVHLARAKQPIEKWLPLIHHQQWAQAWFTVEGAYGGYLQDVQRVWEQFERLDRQTMETSGKAYHFGNQVRCVLIEASLHSLAGNIPHELLVQLVRHNIWTFAQALVTIRQMIDGWNQAQSIIELMPYLSSSQLGEAIQATREIQHEVGRAEALRALAERQPELLGEAIQAAREIRNEDWRAEVLCALAEHQPELLGEAIQAARAIQNDWRRAEVLCALAEHQPELLGEAFQAAREIRNEDWRAEALLVLTARQPELLGEALQAAREIRNEDWRAEALLFLAKYLPQEVLGEALQAAREIQNDWSRAKALSTLAEYLPQELLGEAFQAAREIQDERYRADALSALAEYFPQELLGEAFQASREIQDKRSRAKALSALAARQPELLGEALQAAREIQDDWYRAEALSALAARQPELLGEALQAAREIQDEGHRAEALSALAARQPELLGEALQAAREIQDEGHRAEALFTLAKYLPQEMLGEALQAAREIQVNWGSAAVLRVLAGHLPQELLGEALQAAREIQDEGYRAEALSALAARQPELLGEALQTARAIQNDWSRAAALSALAARQPELLGEALQATRAIQNDGNRAEALFTLAEHQPELLGEALQAARATQDDGKRAAALLALAARQPELLGEALQATRAIQDDGRRAEALSALAARQPELLGEALQATRAIQNDWSRAEALFTLAEYLPPELLGEALQATRELQIDPRRTAALGRLAPKISQLPPWSCYSLIAETLPFLATHPRPDALADITALMEPILAIGTDSTPFEIAQAIKDVSTWWP